MEHKTHSRGNGAQKEEKFSHKNGRLNPGSLAEREDSVRLTSSTN
jgi:hypothetical protein